MVGIAHGQSLDVDASGRRPRRCSVQHGLLRGDGLGVEFGIVLQTFHAGHARLDFGEGADRPVERPPETQGKRQHHAGCTGGDQAFAGKHGNANAGGKGHQTTDERHPHGEPAVEQNAAPVHPLIPTQHGVEDVHEVLLAAIAVDHVKPGDHFLEVGIAWRTRDGLQTLGLAGGTTVVTLQTVVDEQDGDEDDDDEWQDADDQDERG